MLRAADGCYEEDECWAIVAFTFPHLFTGFERRSAERTMKDSFPEAWEAIFGTVLGPGESRTKDRARRSMPTMPATGSSFQRSSPSIRRASSSASPRRGGRRGAGSRSGAFLFPATNTKSAASASSSIPDRHAALCWPVQLRRLAGKGVAMTHVAQAPHPALPHGGGAPANAASAGHGRPADHPAHDRADPGNCCHARHLSSGESRPTCARLLERYRSQLAALTAERQPEIDALSRKLARQEQAIARFLDRHGEVVPTTSEHVDR